MSLSDHLYLCRILIFVGDSW